jgi:hypothetical protein
VVRAGTDGQALLTFQGKNPWKTFTLDHLYHLFHLYQKVMGR